MFLSALDNYRARIEGSIGTSLKDYVKKQVRTNLDVFLDISQYGMDVTIDGETQRIGIMTGGMTDVRDEVLVLSKPDVLRMGTLFEWDGEYWVVVKREARVIKESFYGTAYRCNVDLKWVDKEGNLISQKAYAKGRGMSSILVENQYTDPPVMTRDVDTPITVITQRNLELEQDMRFLFNGQPYRVTFVDNLSIDGTTILGMYDDILQDGDDVVNNVADYSDWTYTISLDFEPDVVWTVDTPFEVKYHVLLNGEIVDEKPIEIIVPEDTCEIEGNVIIPKVAEDIPVRVELESNELIYSEFVIHTGEEWVKNNVFLVGSDSIAWFTEQTYRLNTNEMAEFIVTFPEKVKGTYTTTDNSITVGVGDKYSGTIKLIAITTDEGQESVVYEKNIEIVSVG